MRVFHFGDNGGGEIDDFWSRACGRTVRHVEVGLILTSRPFSTWGSLGLKASAAMSPCPA